MREFTDWSEVLHYCSNHAWIYYQAPFDYHPVVVAVWRVYKNGKIRLKGPESSFTVDAWHLSRMFRPC